MTPEPNTLKWLADMLEAGTLPPGKYPTAAAAIRDAITADRDEVARLKAELQTIVASCSHVGMGKRPDEIAHRAILFHDELCDQRDEIDSLAARLREAVGLLEKLLRYGPESGAARIDVPAFLALHQGT